MIREAILNDALVLDKLLTKLIEDEKNNYDNSIDNVLIKDYYKNYIDKDNHKIYVYLSDEKIVGYIYIIITNNIAKIDALYVENEYRRMHIASKLLNKALTYIKEENISIVDINVMSQNKKAIKLYEKYGFVSLRETRRLVI